MKAHWVLLACLWGACEEEEDEGPCTDGDQSCVGDLRSTCRDGAWEDPESCPPLNAGGVPIPTRCVSGECRP